MFQPKLLALITQMRDMPGFFRESSAQPVSLLPADLVRPENKVVLPSDAVVARLPEPLALSLPSLPKPFRLGDAAQLLYPQSPPDFSRSNVALVAHWSEDGSVAPYLLYFMRALRASGWRVILASGCQPVLSQDLLRLCDAVVARSCTGYDFTSWKAAFECLPSLFHTSQILLTNDSIFAPLGDLEPVHAAMEPVDCDFWGLVASRERMRHLQSYYLVFRASAVRHPSFAVFWDGVDTNPEKFNTVFRYELVLSPWLELHGLQPAAFVPFDALPESNVNPSHYFWRELIQRYHVPIIKRDILRNARNHPYLCGWRRVVASTGYDMNLLLSQLEKS